jgi:RNA recognition motif-containing protein
VSNNSDVPRAARQVFLGNLSYNADEDMIRDAFDGIGVHVTQIRIVVDPQSQRSKGFAFIDIDPWETASLDDIISKIDGTLFFDRPCRASHVTPKAPRVRPQADYHQTPRGGKPKRGGGQSGKGSRRNSSRSDNDDHGW